MTSALEGLLASGSATEQSTSKMNTSRRRYRSSSPWSSGRSLLAKHRASSGSRGGRRGVSADGTAPRPLSQSVHLLSPGHGERHGIAQLAKHDLGAQFLPVRVSAVEGAFHGLLDFGAAEPLRGTRQCLQIKSGRVATLTLQVHPKDLLALFRAGQIHEEDFIESPFAD